MRVGSFRIVYAIVGDEVRVTEIVRRGMDYRGYWHDVAASVGPIFQSNYSGA